MTRSANYVVTQYCKEEDHLASTINNRGCNCTCMCHTIPPVSFTWALCLCSLPVSHLSLPELAKPEGDSAPGTCRCWEAAGYQAQAGCCHRCLLTLFREPGAGPECLDLRLQIVMTTPLRAKDK